ncbi:hypothetical protein GT037_006158 [Alternaria burnsii]|uniref:Uncharacterized protein n=1 Tax=Alternaria burnsii TaxID=1187904 RepID=A0A8H7B5K5_9PLEO|nr:uncharacterized protein GT037_006158 [Alternaria burnsii]KAF7675439.1 hypothetical protein GT037_006158 [Alternaria burnsii]
MGPSPTLASWSISTMSLSVRAFRSRYDLTPLIDCEAFVSVSIHPMPRYYRCRHTHTRDVRTCCAKQHLLSTT